MRSKPDEFIQALGAQWICAVMDRIFGQSNLANVPALMSGFGSLLDHPSAAKGARVLISTEK